MPANFTAASGSGGVRTQLVSFQSAGTAAVAYLADYTNTFLAPQSTVVTSASAFQLPVASLVNKVDSKYYAPTYANASTASARLLRRQASSQRRIRPTVPNAGNPASGYPVSGTSQIILSQCYANAAVKTNVHDFLNNHFTNASYASVVHGNGFDTVPSSYQTAISNDFLSNASGYNLDIGNTSVARVRWSAAKRSATSRLTSATAPLGPQGRSSYLCPPSALRATPKFPTRRDTTLTHQQEHLMRLRQRNSTNS